jgi:hypothetical protein
MKKALFRRLADAVVLLNYKWRLRKQRLSAERTVDRIHAATISGKHLPPLPEDIFEL